MATHKLTLRQKHELKRFYEDGARDVDLAQWFGVSEATVRFHTKEFRRKHPRRTFDHDRAKKLKDQGVSYAVIAQRMGVDDRSVVKALRRLEGMTA